SGVDTSENAQAMEAIRDVGSRGPDEARHFLGTEHTQNNFEKAFYRSELTDNNSFEQWELEGSKRIEDRANAVARSQLDNDEAPALDEGIDEALLAFIAEKKASMPDAFH
ncbi:MAG: trimethylamine methyltransferase family protein, partial [Hyphomicrobiaceae bacterium]